MSSPEYIQWTILADRLADGDEISGEERLFYDRYASEHPQCAREQALLSELADLEAAPDASSGALVDSVLEALAREQQVDSTVDDKRESANGEYKPLRTVAGVLALAACGLLALQLSSTGAPAGKELSALSHDSKLPVGTPESSRLELVYASGDARVGNTVASAGAALLQDADLIEVGEGRACLVLDPNIDVCLDGHSRLRVQRLGGGDRRLELLEGRVALQLDKQPKGMSITVVADGVESTAVGTAFSVAREQGSVSTTVMEGRVRVRRGNAAHLVDAHRRIRLNGPQPVHSTLTRAEEAPEWEVLSPRALWVENLAGELLVRGASENDAGHFDVLLDGRSIGHTPLSTLVPPGEHEIVVRSEKLEVIRQSIEVLAGRRAEVLFAAAPPQTPPSEASEGHALTRKGPSPTELLSGARHMMVEGRWPEAAGIYRSLRKLHPRSPEAHTVLVSLGQLELDRLGQPQGALRLLDRYLMDGGGALEEEARYTRIRALRRLEQPLAEKDAIGLFLSAHPNSFHTRALQRRLLELDGDAE